MWVSNRLIMIFFLKPWQQQGYLHDKKKKKANYKKNRTVNKKLYKTFKINTRQF